MKSNKNWFSKLSLVGVFLGLTFGLSASAEIFDEITIEGKIKGLTKRDIALETTKSGKTVLIPRKYLLKLRSKDLKPGRYLSTVVSLTDIVKHNKKYNRSFRKRKR